MKGAGHYLVPTPAILKIQIKCQKPTNTPVSHYNMKIGCDVSGLTKDMIDHLLRTYDAVILGGSATWLMFWPAWRTL